MSRILSFFDHFKPGVAQSLGLIGWLLVGALLGNIVVLLVQNTFGSDAALSYGTLLSYPLTFVPAVLYALLKSAKARKAGEEGSEVDWHGFPGFRMGLEAIAVTIAVGFVVEPLQMLLPDIPEKLKILLESVTGGNIVISMLCAAVMAPVLEEWLCRGMIMRGLIANGKSPWFAIIFSAFIFALIHLNPWQAIPAFLLGCLFGFVYYRTHSLKITMLMHCANNTFAIILGHIDRFKDVTNWYEVLDPLTYWATFAVLLLAVGLFIKSYR
ncbi:MAG: CPBP family intramembrane metalloprotease [Bacteroidales bacterium]|nr:CPBP family intramembrane metalloprotease [Bacteroidales bacterium]